MGVKERSRLRVGAIALAAVVFAAGNRSAVSAQEPGFMRPTAVWSGPAAPLAAGRYAAAVDLATAPDGALWLLDGLGSGLHRRSADGDWTRLLPLPGGLNGQRLTAASDWLWLLGRRGTAWRLLRLMPAGGTDLELAVGALGQTPIDLSARPDGGVVLALAAPATVELRLANGSPAVSLAVADLFQAGCARARPTAVVADGASGFWLGLERDASSCPGGPSPDPGDLRPPVVDGAVHVDLRGKPVIDRVEPGEAPIDLALRSAELWTLTATGIQPVGQPPIALLPEARPWSATALAWLSDGRAAVVTRGCPRGAVLALAEGRAPVPIGLMARPLGRAPLLPLRLAELGGRVQSLEGAPPGGAVWPDEDTAALLLDWDPTGRPQGAEPICGLGAGAWEGYLADLTTADGALWRLWPGGLEALAGGLPTGGLQAAATGGWWGAVAADSGRVAVLDLAEAKVRAFGADGASLSVWPVEGLPVDIGLRGRFAYLSDPARRRVTVHDVLTGARLAAFGSHLPLMRLQAMADGGILGLAAGNWALSYSADGRLRAAWPLHQAPDTVHTDLLAGADGRVTAARLRVAPVGRDGDWTAAAVTDAALDRYESPAEAPPLPDITAGEACVVRADKTLAAARIPLGGDLTVRIQLDGSCPQRPRPGRLLFLLDAPPQEPAARLAAQGALVTLLARLDDQRLALGLLASQDGQLLELTPGSDAAAIRRLGLQPDLGATDLTKAIARAADRLAAPGAEPHLALILTRPPAASDAAAQRAALTVARQRGIAITALLYPPADLSMAGRRDWAALFEAGEAQLTPTPFQLPLLLSRLAPAEAAEPAFAALTLRDLLPPGMAPLPGSVSPPDGQWDPSTGSLTWRRDSAASDGLRFSYRLRPLVAGPLAIGRPGAGADYRDGFGYAARLTLPRPEAELLAPDKIFLPLLSRGACLGRRRPLDLVLVLDLSGSMAEAAIGGGSKLDAARAAALAVLDLLDWRLDAVGVVGFSGRADLILPLSGDRAAVAAALTGLRTAEGTRIDLGLTAADRALAGAGRPVARPVVILLTDGRQEAGLEADAATAARTLKARGVTVYAIGLGADADAALLRAIASDPARYLASPDTSDLAGLFAAILRAEVCGH
ncbi:MAG TPA: VWA domain-containing protein [Anaerolineae bacterium]|nr:VWA domain-containing protein [Anaerolineae bacterium]